MDTFDLLDKWKEFVASGYFDKLPRLKRCMSEDVTAYYTDGKSNRMNVYLDNEAQAEWVGKNVLQGTQDAFSAFVGEPVLFSIIVENQSTDGEEEESQPTLFDQQKGLRKAGQGRQTCITYGYGREEREAERLRKEKTASFKIVGQILASILYTALFSGLMYLLIVLPLAWIVSLPVWAMVLFLLFGCPIIFGLIHLAQEYAAYPFSWIVKENPVSLVLSIGILAFCVVRSTIYLWQMNGGAGFWPAVVCVVATIELLWLLVRVVPAIVKSF